MYEILVMTNEKVGLDSIEVVEHIYTSRDAVTAERFLFKLREAGFTPRLRRFEVQPLYYSDFSNIIDALKGSKK